jgi:cytochrome P450
MSIRSSTPERASRSVRALRRAASDPIAFLDALARQGDVVPFAIGRRPAFLLNHPAHIEEVLISQQHRFVKGPAFERAGRLLGTGLLTAEGPLHRARRRLAQPAFHRAQMERLAGTMVARAADERRAWRSGEPFDLAARMAALTFDIAGGALFGADLAAHAADVRRAVNAATASADSLVSLLAPIRRVSRARRELDTIVDAIVDRRRQPARQPSSEKDLLSLLLDAEAEADAEPSRQLRDDVMTLLLAGHDTIASALIWTWTLLARHPRADDQLARELRTVLGDRLPAAADLGRLPFTRGVLAESLRLYPPAWVLARLAVQPYRAGATVIPAGSLVIMSQYLVHRDPRFFDDPLTFAPERWSADAQPPRPKLAYFPFGAGPRSCIGEPFAWMEGVLLLATIGQRWRLQSAGASAEPAAQVTLRPRGAVLMVPEARDSSRI